MTTPHLQPEKGQGHGSTLVLPPLNIERHELPNGLTILVQPDFSAPVVSLQYWCATGSIHEGRWLGGGISHLLEHLMFKGTPGMGNSQMAQRIQDLGGHMNAYTSFDRTVYYVDLPAENWLPALELWTDSMQNSSIPLAEFEPEKEVIRREFAMGSDNPDSVFNKLIFHSAFSAHPYRFPVIGHLDLFNQITRDDVLTYYRERYTPQNLTLLVVGAVDPQAVFDAAARLWASTTRRWLPDQVIPDEPQQLSARLIRKPFPTEIVRLALLYPIPGLGHPDIPALQLLGMILGHGRSSRLHLAMVENEGLAEEIDAFAYAPAKVGLFGIDARCQPASHDALIARLRDELKGLSERPPTELELERAKRLCLTQQIHQLKTMSGKASAIGSGWMLARDPHFNESFLHQLERVTIDEINAVVKRYLLPVRETLVELVPENHGLSPRETGGPAAPTTGLRLLPGLGAFKVLHHPSHKLPLVAYRATLPGGLLYEPPGQAGISRLTSQMLLKGTRQRNAEQLSREIEQLGGHLHADSGNNSAALSLELLAQDWSRGLDLFAEILSVPLFTEKELATEKRKQLVSIQIEQDQPMALCRDLLKSALFGTHPYSHSTLGTRESVESITLQDVQQFAQSVLQSASAVYAVTGPQDPSLWAPALQSRLASASNRVSPTISLAPPERDFETPIWVERTTTKEQAILQIAFPIPGAIHPHQIPLALLHEALADLGTRLFVRIREQLGLAYFVSVSRFLGLAGGYFVFYAGTDPARRKLVEEAMLEEIRRLADFGLTPPELERARAKLLSEDKINSQNPACVSAGASLDEYLGQGYQYHMIRQQLLQTTTLDEVNHVAQVYLQKEKYVIATVSPE